MLFVDLDGDHVGSLYENINDIFFYEWCYTSIYESSFNVNRSWEALNVKQISICGILEIKQNELKTFSQFVNFLILKIALSHMLSKQTKLFRSIFPILMFLPTILIPVTFHMMYSAYKLNKQGDNIALVYSFPNLQPVCCSTSSSNCCFLTCIQISQEADQVVWYSHPFKNAPVCCNLHSQCQRPLLRLYSGSDK